MAELLKKSLVRIFDASKNIVGAGFLIERSYIVTCAHVVNFATGLSENNTIQPTDKVMLDFPDSVAGKLYFADIVLWIPPDRTTGGDVAALLLDSDPPASARHISLVDTPLDLWQHPFRVFGFPPGFDNGVIATGRILDYQFQTRWVQLEDVKQQGRRIESGFSGAPVWDEKLRTIVGMVVASDNKPETKTAFVIPMEILAVSCRSIVWTALDDELPGKGYWHKTLEGPHLQIAIDRSRHLRVLAGPGTGKTYSLIRRTARLIEEGADPSRILLVTFTRAAARDLERELQRLQVNGVSKVIKGTLHSFCFRLLSEAQTLDRAGRTITHILLDFEERFLLEDLKDEGRFGTFHDRSRKLKQFEAAWAKEKDQEPGWLADELDHRFDQLLRDWLEFHDAMIVEEIVPETLRYLRDNPASPVMLQFEHVLVDEYQDLCKAEQTIIDLIGSNGTLTVVGDEDQSIYERFRFAHRGGLTNLHLRYPRVRDISLDVCRRCPKAVVSMATSLISRTNNRTARTLKPIDSAENGSVYIVQWKDMDEEANGLAQYIYTNVQSGRFKVDEVLVLCPRREFGRLLKERLIRFHQLPARSFFHEDEFQGNSKELTNSKAQQAFTLLTLISDPSDKVALRCWLGYGSNDLASRQYERLVKFCKETGLTARDALNELVTGNIKIPHTDSLVARYQALIQLIKATEGKTYAEIFDLLFPSGELWAEAFRNIIERIDNDANLSQYIETIRTAVTQPELPNKVDFIRIMSLHKSKGLTADHVIVTGCIKGLLPRVDKDLPFDEQRADVEEQLRLFYVAITRPRQTLVLSSVMNIPRPLARKMGVKIFGNHPTIAETEASEFLSYLGPIRPQPIRGDKWGYE